MTVIKQVVEWQTAIAFHQDHTPDLPSCIASPAFGQYQIILLGDTGTGNGMCELPKLVT